LSDELKDKVAYITFTLQVSKGSAPGTLNYKKSIRAFDEGDPQEWMDVITGLREIWAQNSIMVPTDMSNTVVALLKGESLTAYEAAVEDKRTNPDDKTLMVPMTIKHIDDSLLAVSNIVLPYLALETQKQWMSKYIRKLYNMGVKQFTTSMSRINNYILYFPNATVLSEYSEEELIGILEFAVPSHWRKAFDLRDYLPTSDDKARFISVSVNALSGTKRLLQENLTRVTMTTKATTKTKFAKSEKSATKSGQKCNIRENWANALEQEILYAYDPDTTDAERIQGIIESKYTPVDLSKIVEECTHLEKAERRQLLHLLQKYEDLFDGSLGTWKTDQNQLELKDPNVKPYHAKPYPVPHSQEKKLKDEIRKFMQIWSVKKD
jgi:hypothetical protein